LIGVRWTGVVLALPALVPIAVMILAPGLGHRLARSRSRGGQLESKPESKPVVTYVPDREQRADPAVGSDVVVAVP
jgi:hypothetical protein